MCIRDRAGTAWRRYQRGEVKSEDFGFEAGEVLDEGVRLPEPFLEVSTKFEKFDRNLDREEALEISNLDPAELDAILAIVLEVDSVIDRETSKRGLIHVDGKKEFALGEGREPILIDSFGTLDEDRWWDADAYEDGEIVQLSKESVRKHYIESGHHSALYEARQSGSPEPPIPPLPDSIIASTAELYASMFERLTGEAL